MGLLSRLNLERGVQAARGLLRGLNRPSGYTQNEWDLVRHGLDQGNEKLKLAMLRDAPSKNWEHGAWSHPDEQILELATSGKRHEVNIPAPMEIRDKAVMYHSHPNFMQNMDGDSSPSPLSLTDLLAGGYYMRGNASLDALGGYGLAIRNPRVRLWVDEIRAADSAAYLEARRHLEKSGANQRMGILDLDHSPVATVTDADIASGLGLGDAMKRTGLLEEFHYLPGTDSQAKRLTDISGAREVGAQKAEELIRTWLKARGISEKDIAGIIASIGSAGLMAATAKKIQENASA